MYYAYNINSSIKKGMKIKYYENLKLLVQIFFEITKKISHFFLFYSVYGKSRKITSLYKIFSKLHFLYK